MAKIGDIIEIKTKEGFRYIQVSHYHEKFGFVVHVYKNSYEKSASVEDIISSPVSYSTFLYVNELLNSDFVKVVGNTDKNLAKNMPIFRIPGLRDPQTFKVTKWWLSNNEYGEGIEKLSDDQAKLPIRAIWDGALLSKRLEEGWEPSWEV